MGDNITMVLPYKILQLSGTPIPLVISVPHTGTIIPTAVKAGMHEEFYERQPDTDWLVEKLYDFMVPKGATLIHAVYSRYVIDLNRDPVGKKLYSDGRQETELVPTRTFTGAPIYCGVGPDSAEVERRTVEYYHPYHQVLRETLQDLRRTFKHVLLFEGHSIARFVPTIRPAPFPDLILGDQEGKTAHPKLTAVALQSLRGEGGLQVSHNDPFKGGFITRHFGRPAEGIHSLQLEMSQDMYLEGDDTSKISAAKFARLQPIFARMFDGLIETLRTLP